MRRLLMAMALILAASAAAQAADTCKDEVASALERQRKSSGFRMQTKMISEQGLVDMTVEYVLPDRMRQVIKSTADPDPIETVLVGKRAWSRRQGDQNWTPLNPKLTADLVNQLEENLGDEPGELGEFECLGKKSVDGKEMLAYMGENQTGNPEDKKKAKPKLPDRPVRVIYVDPTTGLPMRSIFARADKLEKPIFQANYSYPVDLTIEAPKPPAKAETTSDTKPK